MANDIYANVNRAPLTIDEFPDNPGTFGSALKLLKDAKQICICHMGFRFDSYMGICSHLCSYCYAAGQNMRYLRNLVQDIKLADLDDVKRTFSIALDTYKPSVNLEINCIRHRYPLRCGTQTDCFQLAEQKYGITYRFIDEIMNKYDYPYMICTKNKLVADDKYMALYRDNVAFQFTLSTLDQGYLDKIERGASTAQERLAAMKKLSDAGYRVICRISPYIPEYMTDLEELVAALAAHGCHHVISELLRISPILNQVMIQETGFDVVRLYKSKGVKMTGGYYRYPLKEKIEYQRKLKEYCDKYGMTFATCGDEDPSFHTTKMCCGLEGLERFESVPYCTYDTMYNIAKEKGVVTLDDMFFYYCADQQQFVKQWESGYFMQVIKNVEYDSATNTYKYVETNSFIRHSYESNNQPTLFG
jgi:DNA repair photolyase